MPLITSTPLRLRASIESWPIAGTFTISRGAKTEAHVVVVELTDGQHTGRGECVPYPRYGESPEEVKAALEKMNAALANGLDRAALQKTLPAGAARNALDCAFWDLEAKRYGRPVYELAGLPEPKPLQTVYTISLGEPEAMAEAAANAAPVWPALKIKLGAPRDDERLRAIRRAAPKTAVIVDANEGWNDDNIGHNLDVCAEVGVKLVEQPLPAACDGPLGAIPHPVPICADESARGLASLAGVKGKYEAINIKLDKTGGLTEALDMAERAEAMGLGLMVGCMVSTSLSIAPAFLVAQRASFVDLDGPMLLANDRPDGMRYANGFLYPPRAGLWG